MVFQTKHIDNSPIVRIKALTTVIGIKCKDCIVLASDSRGTSEEGKTKEIKIFNVINTSIGIGTSGNADSIRDFLKNIKIENKPYSEEKLREELYQNAIEFKKPTLSNNLSENGIKDINIYSPIAIYALVGTRLQNGDYCLYQIQLNDENPTSINVIDKSYGSVGSGKKLADLVLYQQNRINNLGELDINTAIGVALYVIDEVKHKDHLSGEDIQIAVIDKNGYNPISLNEHSKYYDDMINSLSNSLGKNLSDNGKIKEILKKIFPVSRTILL
jgi:20S proteasome alpha/beta subunit